jgi:hypothetical protein
VVLRDCRIDEVAAQCFEAFERALLVVTNETRIALDIRSKDGGDPPRRGGVAIG